MAPDTAACACNVTWLPQDRADHLPKPTKRGRPAMTVDEIDRRMSEVLSWLAQSGMKHDTFDNVYIPLLGLRDRLVPGKYS